MSKWKWGLGVGLLLVGAASVWFWLDWERGKDRLYPIVEDVEPLLAEEEVVEVEARKTHGWSALEAGDTVEDLKRPRLLRHYGDAERTAADDLDLVDGVLQHFWMLFKDPDLLVVGSNEDVVKCLTGGNPEGIEFVSPDNPFVDDEGRLLDRWGQPLFFHAESLRSIEVRSSGPDGLRFTQDDVVVKARSSARFKR